MTVYEPDEAEAAVSRYEAEADYEADQRMEETRDEAREREDW